MLLNTTSEHLHLLSFELLSEAMLISIWRAGRSASRAPLAASGAGLAAGSVLAGRSPRVNQVSRLI